MSSSPISPTAHYTGYVWARNGLSHPELERAIETRGVSQVVEVAAGLSPRGWRFVTRYGERLTYIEADLRDMAARKRGALERMGSLGEHHRVVALDALREDGPESLSAVASELERSGKRLVA